jgi:hypothetical protein
MRSIFCIGTCAAALLLLANASPAALLITSPNAPIGAAISQPDFSAAAFNGGQDFTDNAGPPGQTFTATAATPFFSTLTLKGFANTGASFGGNVNTGTWTITLSRVDAGNVLTQLAQETASPAAVTSGSDYVTLALTAPVALTNGTQYAFDVFSSQGYFGFAKSSTDVYAGGAAIQHGATSRTSANGATIANVQTVDRTFFINAPVPEPGALALIGTAALAVALRRRRTAR